MEAVTKVTVFGPDKLDTGEYEVRWRVFLAAGGHKDRRKRHQRKGLADAMVDNLRKAEVATVERNGRQWGWDERLHPVLFDNSATPSTDDRDIDTVWRLVTDWRTATWRKASGNGRRSHAITLRAMARELVRDDAPPAPPGVEGYLTAVAFRGEEEPTKEELYEQFPDGLKHRDVTGVVPAYELWEAREWLEDYSLPLALLDRARLRQLISHLGKGRAGGSERRYWMNAQAVLNWGTDEAGPDGAPRVAPGLTRGLEVRGSTRRTVEEVGAVPTEPEMWRFAWACGLSSGPRWCALPLLMGGAGLRIGECAALLRRHIREDSRTEGLWIEVRNNRATPGKSWTDSGERFEDRGTKGRGPEGNRRGRTTYLPPDEAAVLRLHLELFVGKGPDSPVFTGVNGGRLDGSRLDRDVWAPACKLAFPEPHRLSGLNPHACRHLAATRWLRAGIPLTTAARWGGWAQVSTMVDFYDSVLPNDDDSAASLMGKG